MSKNKLLFNSIISILIVFLCLFIFINKLNGEIIISDLLINICDGWLYLMLASILLIFSVLLLIVIDCQYFLVIIVNMLFVFIDLC